jgi:putative transcriptional regulator
LGDANFAETVVLLIEYNQNGAMGIVINRPAEVQLSTLLPDVEELQNRTDLAYIGGPVGRGQMLILARCKSQPQGSLRVFEDVYAIPGQLAFERLIHDTDAGTKFRAYLGYAGWAAGQLNFEIAQGGWHVVPADTTTVFDKTPGEIWPELIRRSEAQWVRRQAPDLVSLVLIKEH